MPNHLLRCAAALAVTVCSTNSLADITVSYDKFTGTTSIRTNSGYYIDGNHLHPMMEADLDQTGRVVDMAILLNGRFEGWRYLQCHEVHWLADGKPLQLPTAKYDGSVLSGGWVYESLIQYLKSPSLARKMAHADRIEYKVCNDEYQFTSGEVDDFKELWARAYGGESP